MTRLLSAITAIVAVLFTIGDAAGQSIAGKRPNIVFVLTDDQGYGDLSAHGNPVLKTPNLDRLHDQGVRFTDFHVSPTCSPTRSALLTGRHEFKNGVTHTILERERLAPSTTTLAQVLKSAGYTTGIFGKWHLGDEPDHWPSKRGFDEMFIHGCGGIGQSFPGSCGDTPGNSYFSPTILHNGTFEKTKGYCTDVFFNQASSWIEGVKAKDQPFFCYIATNAPHAPLQVRPEDEARYAGKVETPSVAKFFGMVSNIDDNVGRLLDRLKGWGLERDTLVIFMNDNGGTAGVQIHNAGMRGMKVTPWIGGTRASSFWRWPGTLKPADCDRLTAHIDFLPTLAEIAGAKLSDPVKAQVEGRSLVPLLENPTAGWADRTLFTHVGRWPKGANPNDHKLEDCSVRTKRWHMVIAGTGSWQLFDISSDPGEIKNVAEQHPDVMKTLGDEYDAWWASLAPYFVNENATPPAANPFKTLYETQFGTRSPNVVIIYADDLGYADIGGFGGSKVETPNLDRLAGEGRKFTNFHVAQAVCSASRAGLLTGCYPNRIGIHGALGPNARHGISDGEMTIAEVLKTKGYATGMAGKWHLGHHPRFLPTRHGFDEYLGLPYSNDMWPHHPEAKPGTYPPLPMIDGEKVVDPDVSPDDQKRLTAMYTERAVSFIERHKDVPFFFYLAYAMPHVPLFTGEAFDGKTRKGTYADVIREIDWSVGEVLKSLDAQGIAKDTIVVFASDNGPWLSYGNHAGSAGPLREGKGTSWEGGVRVPCVMRWPGTIPAGTESPAMLMTIDLLPTIAKAAGATLPDHPIDGLDVLDILTRGPNAKNPHEAYLFYYDQNQLQAVTSGDGRWKLVLPHTYRTLAGRPGGRDGKPVRYASRTVEHPELYDLKADPGEAADVSAMHPEIVGRLSEVAEKARDDLGDALTKREGKGTRSPGQLDGNGR